MKPLVPLEPAVDIGVWMAAAFRFDGRAAKITEALRDVGSILFTPAGVVLFFKVGPFAWNGIVGIYLPAADDHDGRGTVGGSRSADPVLTGVQP